MVKIGKVEPEGRPVRSGPSFSEVRITGLPKGSIFPILTNDPVIDNFSCLSTFLDNFSAVEILWSFVRHRSDRILDFVGPNKILSDQTFIKPFVKNDVWCYFQLFKGKKYSLTFKVLPVPTKIAK